jgi:predicted nucleic acid-binding protein
LPHSTTSVAVADTGPLIALARLDHLALLPKLFARTLVPEAVLAECTVRPELMDAVRIRQACDSGLLDVCAAEPIVATTHLGRGERFAIGKALEMRAALLADDLAARRQAQSMGLTTIGTLGVLVGAKRGGLLTEVRPLFEALRVSGYWIGDEALRAGLRAAGEGDM